MLQVTHAAAARLLATRLKLRVPREFGVHLSGDPRQGRFAIGFVPEPSRDDVAASRLGVTFYMSPGLSDLLSDWTLDLRPVGGQLALVLVRQNIDWSQLDGPQLGGPQLDGPRLGGGTVRTAGDA